MKKLGVVIVTLAAASLLVAHPHFRKSVTVDLAGGVKATISYTTVPGNEMHARNAEVGAFVTPRGPRLSLSGDVQAGSMSIPAGSYTIGVIKNGSDDWTLALYPGRLGRGETPDPASLIKLDSTYSSGGGAEHLRLDITPGQGRLEGKAVLLLEFGSMSCAGALS